MLIKSYIVLAIRSFRKQLYFNLAGITGLVLGLTFSMLISLYVFDEGSYDTLHSNSDRIYRVHQMMKGENKVIDGAVTSSALGTYLKRDFNEIEDFATIYHFDNFYFYDTKGVKLDPIQSAYFASPNFFNVLSYPLVAKKDSGILSHPFSIVMSEDAAKKYFGEKNPLGQKIRIASGYEMEVTGVLSKTRYKSHFVPEILVSMNLMDSIFRNNKAYENLGSFDYTYNYLLLKSGVDASDFERKLNESIDKFQIDLYKGKASFTLMNINDIHLNSNKQWEIQPNGNKLYVYSFVCVAIFILFLASLNYINLALNKSLKRRTEVGVRKVCGATRQTVGFQFFSESYVYVFISSAISWLLSLYLLPYFNSILGKDFHSSLWLNFSLIAAVILTITLVGFLSSLYPALFLARMESSVVFRSPFPHLSRKRFSLMRILLILQLTVTGVLITIIVVMKDQLSYLNNYDLGFNQENVLVIDIEKLVRSRVPEFMASLNRLPHITATASSSFSIAEPQSSDVFRFQTTAAVVPVAVNANAVNYTFASLLEIPLVSGRYFLSPQEEEPGAAILVNETLVKTLKWEEDGGAIGKKVGYPFSDGLTGTVVGVVKDFHAQSLHEKVKPTILVNWNFKNHLVMVKYNQKAELSNIIQSVETEFRKVFKDTYFKYSVLKQDIAANYKEDVMREKLLTACAFVILAIAILGIVSFVSFDCKRREKEIAIRKVNGASDLTLFLFLLKDYIMLAVAAIIIILPLSYVLAKAWLQNYPYRIDMASSQVLWPCGLIFFLVLATILFKVVKTAKANPASVMNDHT
jgi:putative ABC transport system permease protein